MTNYFNCKVVYDKTRENGLIDKVTEEYIVNALSFTEAEAVICRECQCLTEMTVKAITKTRITNLIKGIGESFYKYKIEYIHVNEETGIEKRSAEIGLILAEDFAEANKKLNEYTKKIVADVEIVGLNKTNIVEVYEYADAKEVTAIEQ